MDDNMGATTIGQSRRARRLMQVIAERFIRAYLIPILDWIGRAAVKEENK